MFQIYNLIFTAGQGQRRRQIFPKKKITTEYMTNQTLSTKKKLTNFLVLWFLFCYYLEAGCQPSKQVLCAQKWSFFGNIWRPLWPWFTEKLIISFTEAVLQPTPAITLRSIGGIFDLFFMAGPNPKHIVSQYNRLIGKPFLPPYWSLGTVHSTHFCAIFQICVISPIHISFCVI